MGSRGSVIPYFLSLPRSQKTPITDPTMTRFMITLKQGVELVWHALDDMMGGEIYVKKIPSMNILDIAKAVRPDCDYEIVGIRPGEKLHEQMIGYEDSLSTFEYDGYFKILPQIHNWNECPSRIKSGKLVDSNFCYASNTNKHWMTSESLSDWISKNYSL